MRLTQSVLSSAEDCLLRAQYTIDKPEWAVRVAGSVRAVGTAYHAGLELRYAGRLERQGTEDMIGLPLLDDMIGRALEVFARSQTIDLYDDTPVEQFKWDEDVPDAATAELFLGDMLTHYMNGGFEWPFDWQVLAVELNATNVDERLGQIKNGADLVLMGPDGGIVGVDNKTAGKPWGPAKSDPRKQVQAPFYNRQLRTMYPDAPSHRFVFDVMTRPRPRAGITFQRIESNPTLAHEEAVVQRALAFQSVYEEVHVKLGLDLPPNPGSTLCSPKYCDFWDSCPYGAVLDT